jgi:hypothetical protein
MSYQSVLVGNAHHPQRFTSRAFTVIQYVALGLLLIMAADVRPVLGQSLNWEGQTGVFVTPLAYTAASSKKGLGKPIVAYHFLNGGKVLGNFHQASLTVGALGRTEFGYTRDFHSQGSTAGLSNLWGNGFNSFHGKVSFLPEDFAKQKWVPAISAGFVARTQVYNVGGWIEGKRTNNADFYVVATKTITETKKLPIVLNAGYKVTNASVLGLAGNAPAYRGRAFGAVAFVLKGPAKSTIILGSELLQEPRDVQALPGAIVPTTITYAVRIVPPTEKKFNIDFGVAQAAGQIMPGVNLFARHQFALGISYVL